MQQGAFDVRGYAATATGSLRDVLRLGDYAAAPLTTDVLDVVAFLRRREASAVRWMSFVLVTATHKDARMTAFLNAWLFERHWHADALRAIEAEHREPAAGRAAKRPFAVPERVGPLVESIRAIRLGDALRGVHAAEGLADALLLDAMDARLAEVAGSDALAHDLAHLTASRARQIAFFGELTEALLEDPAAAVLARRRLPRRVWPIGADLEPAADARAVFRTLAGPGGGAGWAPRVDERLDAVPGLRGLRLAVRTATHPGRPPRRTSSTGAPSRHPVSTAREGDGSRA